MDQTLLPWALLVVGSPPPRASAPGAQSIIDSPVTLLSRALSLTSIAKTGCLIDDRRRPEWSGVVDQLWSSNVSTLEGNEPVTLAVVARLASIEAQEPAAAVIVIPFNHCAVEELTWLDSVKAAFRLVSANRNTVYLLHDNPENDPRSAFKKPEVCTSSVLIGSVAALLALCRGVRESTIVDLVVDKTTTEDAAIFNDSADGQSAPLNVVHVRLVEEYANLQRRDVWHRRSRMIDVNA